MTTLSGWTVDFSLSPRVITIPVALSSVTAQDQVDTVRKLEDQFSAMSFPRLMDAEGKAGGVTGIVITLQDAQYAPQPRQNSLQTGTVTTANADGKLLIDTSALFATNGVNRGDIVVNTTSGSHTTIVNVNSETEARTLPIVGGPDQRWDLTDSYEIFGYDDFSYTAGDLFAVDSAGAPLNPVLNVFGVGTNTVEQSTSPAAAPIQPNTILEGNITWEQAMRVMFAVLAGKVNGVTTTTERFRDLADTKDRLVTTLDVDGNRTNTTPDGT